MQKFYFKCFPLKEYLLGYAFKRFHFHATSFPQLQRGRTDGGKKRQSINQREREKQWWDQLLLAVGLSVRVERVHGLSDLEI